MKGQAAMRFAFAAAMLAASCGIRYEAAMPPVPEKKIVSRETVQLFRNRQPLTSRECSMLLPESLRRRAERPDGGNLYNP